MPITLLGEQPKATKRGRRRSRQRRTYSLDSAIAVAQPQVGRRPRAAQRPPSRGMAEPVAPANPPAPLISVHIPQGLLRRLVARRWPWALLMASLVAVVVWISVDARFFVYRAVVAGAERIDPHAIYDASGVHEQNILWIQPRVVAESILALPGVKAVRVRCSLPARVTIEVTERQPVVMWRATSQERDWWVDEEGVVLPYHGDAQAATTLFVVDTSQRQLKVGDRIEPKGTVQSVQQLAQALPGIRVFFFHADRGLSFVEQAGQGGWPVYVGTAENIEQKIQVLELITEYLVAGGIRASFVDVRWPDRPVYGTSQGAASGGGG